MLIPYLLILTSLIHSTVATYSLVRSYAGNSFFDRWSYYGNYDNLTNGDVIYVNKSSSASLAYINTAGNAIIKVDNTSVVPFNIKRNSVRITSTDLYPVGSLFVMDALHVPYGCSVWPAWWSQAPNWPSGGEIDTFEGVNLQSHNQMALHTETGCNAGGTSSSETGTLTYGNCSSAANGNNGCSILDANTNSYGAAFSAAGGGVWATQLANTGISIWFFSRKNVPADLLTSNTSAIPNPSTWGIPAAFYPTSSCSIPKFFSSQALVIDITLCGDFAGNAAIFNQTCSGVCYQDYVLNASSYNTAYFEIPSIRIYNDPTLALSNSTPSSSSTSATSTPKSLATKTSGSILAGTLAFIAGLIVVGL